MPIKNGIWHIIPKILKNDFSLGPIEISKQEGKINKSKYRIIGLYQSENNTKLSYPLKEELGLSNQYIKHTLKKSRLLQRNNKYSEKEINSLSNFKHV